MPDEGTDEGEGLLQRRFFARRVVDFGCELSGVQLFIQNGESFRKPGPVGGEVQVRAIQPRDERLLPAQELLEFRVGLPGAENFSTSFGRSSSFFLIIFS